VKYNSGIRPLPDESVRDQYVQHYREAFPDTHLLMRRPFRIAARLGLGLYNDMTAHTEGTREWLGWIASGGEYSQTGEPNALSAMPLRWQQAPVGGELTGSMSMREIFLDEGSQTMQLLRESPYHLHWSGQPL